MLWLSPSFPLPREYLQYCTVVWRSSVQLVQISTAVQHDTLRPKCNKIYLMRALIEFGFDRYLFASKRRKWLNTLKMPKSKDGAMFYIPGSFDIYFLVQSGFTLLQYLIFTFWSNPVLPCYNIWYLLSDPIRVYLATIFDIYFLIQSGFTLLQYYRDESFSNLV